MWATEPWLPQTPFHRRAERHWEQRVLCWNSHVVPVRCHNMLQAMQPAADSTRQPRGGYRISHLQMHACLSFQSCTPTPTLYSTQASTEHFCFDAENAIWLLKHSTLFPCSIWQGPWL